MDLTERATNGKLHPSAACMLLWSGALDLDPEALTASDTRGLADALVVHDDVISLYGVSHEEVLSVLGDLGALLRQLEDDDALNVPSERMAPAVVSALPRERLTGGTLFLLQAGTHPLVVESADKDTLRVRYDEALARGIPNLQELLCRMACHLRVFGEDEGAFVVEFVSIDHARSKSPIAPFDGCVEGGVRRLPPSVAVASTEDVRDLCQNANDSTSPTSGPAGTAALLEASLYTTHALADATRRRVEYLQQKLQRLEGSKPDAGVMGRKPARSTPRGMMGEGVAMRSLGIRAAVYLAFGACLMWLGRLCLTEGDMIAKQLLHAWDQALATATSAINLVTGNAGLVGAVETPPLPTEPMVEALKAVGYVLMTLGIVIPVWRIIRHKRRLDRELAYTQSHRAFFSALSEKRQLHVEAAYAQDLDAWAQGLKHTEEELAIARDSLEALEAAEKDTQRALEACRAQMRANDQQTSDASDAQTVLRSAVRRTDTLVRQVDMQRDEEERRKLIRAHCEKATDLCRASLGNGPKGA